jgi:hypothetical protein
VIPRSSSSGAAAALASAGTGVFDEVGIGTGPTVPLRGAPDIVAAPELATGSPQSAPTSVARTPLWMG